MSDEAIHIVSTGDLPGLPYAGRIIIDILPFLSIELIPDKSTIAQLAGAEISVVFTSANAVDAVILALDGIQPSWVIYCIANSTKARVQDYFKHSQIAGLAANSAELAEQIIKDQPSSIQFFCGNLRRDDIPVKLKENRITVDEHVVYKTVYTPVKLSHKYHGVLFFSPGAVSSFFSANDPDPSVIMFSIGKTTESAIREHCQNKVFISVKPDKLELAQNAIKYFEEKINQ